MDEFNFTLNIFYSIAFNPKRHPDYTHVWAVIRPTDQKWSFSTNLTDIIDAKTKKRLPLSETKWFDLSYALSMISNVIKPDLVMPHLFCSQGATTYRYLKTKYCIVQNF